MSSKLYLIPTPISDAGYQDISPYLLSQITPLRFFVVENLRTARRVLRKYGYIANFDLEVEFFEWDKHEKTQNFSIIDSWMKNGEDIGLMSEAGLPCIADPGHTVVSLAHNRNYTVIPLSGASSIILALIASGFQGQTFTFNGYLPIENIERQKKIKSMESKVISENHTQIFMETPYRNISLFEELLKICSTSISLSIAANITDSNATILTKSIDQWKTSSLPSIHKVPTIFILGQMGA